MTLCVTVLLAGLAQPAASEDATPAGAMAKFGLDRPEAVKSAVARLLSADPELSKSYICSKKWRKEACDAVYDELGILIVENYDRFAEWVSRYVELSFGPDYQSVVDDPKNQYADLPAEICTELPTSEFRCMLVNSALGDFISDFRPVAMARVEARIGPLEREQ